MSRAHEMGWYSAKASIITELFIRDGLITYMNLIEEFGGFTIQELRDHVLTYYNLPARQAQNANMMYYCILSTTTEEVNSKIINETERYIIDGINSGPLLFKFLMSVITIDMRATITNLRMDLTNLDSYIAILKYDIDKFNLFVNEKRKQLSNIKES